MIETREGSKRSGLMHALTRLPKMYVWYAIRAWYTASPFVDYLYLSCAPCCVRCCALIRRTDHSSLGTSNVVNVTTSSPSRMSFHPWKEIPHSVPFRTSVTSFLTCLSVSMVPTKQTHISQISWIPSLSLLHVHQTRQALNPTKDNPDFYSCTPPLRNDGMVNYFAMMGWWTTSE